MTGIKKRDIKKMLKLGAKASGISLADVQNDIEATMLRVFELKVLAIVLEKY